MSAAMPSRSNITRRRGGGKTLKDLKRIKASQQRRQAEEKNLSTGFVVAVLLKYLKQCDVSMYKHIVALMEECDDENKVGDLSSLLPLRKTVGGTNRSIPTSIYTRSGGSVISSLSEVDYAGGAEEKMGYLNTTYQLMTEVESD